MRTLKIGITGGIGAGKSHISRIFTSEYGIPIFYTDLETVKIAKGDAEYKVKVRELFGDEIFTDGEIDRMKISNKVFSSPDNVKKINKLLTPFLMRRLNDFVSFNSDYPYVIVESAIFHEADTTGIVDLLLGVDAPMPIRLERACTRDNHTFTVEQIKKKMENQISQEEKMAGCDFVINNDGDTDLYIEVDRLHKLFEKIYKLTGDSK